MGHIMDNNTEYWNNFYKSFKEDSSSSFAKWISTQNIITPDSKIIDIGCGNGRDTKFILSISSNIVGVDSALLESPDFNFLQSNIEDIITKDCKYDIVYSRFFFHSIPQDVTYDILKWNNGILLAEFRVDGDEPILYPDHTRYLVNAEWFEKVIYELYNVEFICVSKNLAVYKEENPIVMRVIARKKIVVLK